MVCGAITLDAAARVCTVSGEAVKLAPREFELLHCLMRNKGRALSREQLLDKVWGLDFEGGDRAVDARIRSLRAALGGAGGQIKTVSSPATGWRRCEHGGRKTAQAPQAGGAAAHAGLCAALAGLHGPAHGRGTGRAGAEAQHDCQRHARDPHVEVDAVSGAA